MNTKMVRPYPSFSREQTNFSGLDLGIKAGRQADSKTIIKGGQEDQKLTFRR